MNLIDLNKYRLTSLEEPTDEMLSAIMKEVSEEAMRKNKEAQKRYFNELRQQNAEYQKEWEAKIKEYVSQE